MVDPLSAAGLAYPVVKDLFRLAKRLRQAHREIKYAREDLIRVIERIEIVADAYELFHETMAGAKKNKALRRSLRKKRHLMEKVEAESARLLNTLERFTNAFLPLLRNDPLGPVERWISQYRWYRSSKKDVAPVLSRMRILEGSMGVIATLVIIQMLQLADERAANRGVSIQAEINNLRKSLDIGLKKLQDDQRAQVHIVKQRHASARDDISPSKFAQEVLRIVKKDIPKLYRQPPPDSPPTTGSAPSSNPSPSGPQPPSTPPSTPPRVFAGAQSPDTALSATVLPHREPEAYPVASQTQCEPDPQPPATPSLLPQSRLPNRSPDESEQEESIHGAPTNQGKVCVPMAPYGLPEASHRPRPGRSSPDGSIRRDGGDRQLPGSKSSSQVKYRNPRSNRRREGENSSRISVYGDDGEVTPSLLAGLAGFSPEWQRRKERSQS